MDKELKQFISELNYKLDIIAALLLRLISKDKDGISLREQLRLLDELNVRPIDMAKLIGRSSGYVSKELVSIRREK